jgi:hypothetical protein
MSAGKLHLICWLIEKCDEPKDLCAEPWNAIQCLR